MTSASLQRGGFGRSSRGICVVVVALAAMGCKTGTSWTAKPSWWTFGGSGDDPAKLASAPPAAADATMPSATNKPYPTTTTPEGYVLENAQRAGQAQVAAAAPPATTPATEPAAITYGSKPAAAAPVSTPPQIASAAAGAGSLSGIAPQVGPYGAPPASSPLEQSLPPSAPASAFGATAAPAVASAAATGYGMSPPPGTTDPTGVRVADARGAESWSSSTSAAAPPATTGDSRYGTGTGSRFSAPSALAPQQQPAADFPALTPATPAALPGNADPLSAPAAAPSSLAPPTPTRRPDPGYRPGGTSTYRPSRTLLAGEAGAEQGAIQPVSFEMPATERP